MNSEPETLIPDYASKVYLVVVVVVLLLTDRGNFCINLHDLLPRSWRERELYISVFNRTSSWALVWWEQAMSSGELITNS